MVEVLQSHLRAEGSDELQDLHDSDAWLNAYSSTEHAPKEIRNEKKMLSAPCFGTCEAIKCRLISQKQLQMCTKYLYILTHFLEKEEKYSKLSFKFRKGRQSAGNFPTHCRTRRKCGGRFPTLLKNVGRLLKSVGRLSKSVGRL